jgi:hypothetical protein
LLFKGYVDQVFVFGDSSEDPLAHGSVVFTGGKVYLVPPGKHTFRAADLSRDSTVQEIPVERANNPAQFFKPKWRRFRLQHQETCPATESIIATRFAHEVAAGRCLIEEAVDSADADVVLSISKATPARSAYDNRQNDPCRSLSYRGIQNGPTTVTVAERRNGRLTPVEIKTTLVALYAAAPFYFSVRPYGEFVLCLGVATDPFPRSYADPFEMIGRRYGLPIERTSESDRPPRSP